MARPMTPSASARRRPPIEAPGPERVQVDQYLRALPDGEIFQLLRNQLLAHSSVDPAKQWASSSAYFTYGKRSLTTDALARALDATSAAGRQFYEELFGGARAVLESVARQDSQGTVLRLIELGEAFEKQQRRHGARTCYETALELAKPLSDHEPRGLALRRMGRLSQAFGELDRALGFYESAYVLARDSQNALGQAAAAIGLGNLKVDQGRWEEAESHYQTALSLVQKTGDRAQMGQLCNNLSVVRRRMGDMDGAVGFSTRAMIAFEQLGNPDELSRCFNNLGLIRVEQRQFSEALTCYQSALRHAESPYVLAAVRGNLCELYIRQDRLFLAEEQARRAEEIALREGFHLVLVNIYRLLGTLSRLRRDANGMTFFEKALEISETDQYLFAQAEVHLEYAAFRKALGELEEAASHLRQARALFQRLNATKEAKLTEKSLQALSVAGPRRAATGRAAEGSAETAR